MKSALSLILVLMMILSILPVGLAETSTLTDEQRNAIAMLNYITVLTQDINESKNSRLAMEEAYSTLINNTYPNAVDDRTLDQMRELLEVMEDFRMVDVKRERLQYIYEQNQAQALRAAIPNPMGLLSVVQSCDPTQIALALAYMAVDSVTSYVSYTNEVELQYLEDGWVLDDEESQTLHESRSGAFSYMIQMVGEYNIPGDLTLTEDTVDEFVDWKNNTNVVGRIQFLESNQSTYKSYGGYWLVLAQSYFENGDYEKCLSATETYLDLDVRIFRKDYEFAEVLPSVISAAEAIYSGEEYTALAESYTQMILDNTDHSDWALRYYAAQVYVDLYAQTKDGKYLDLAYDVALDNVNYLVSEQRTLNATYLAPVQTVSASAGATKDEKKQVEAYNKTLKENRKTELPPVSEPLLLNCDLLFGLANELNISESEKQKIDGILHQNGEALFLTDELDENYWFFHDSTSEDVEIDVEFGGTAIILPVTCLTTNAQITVTVKEANAVDAVILTDWTIDSVERVTEGDLSSYRAVYTSAEAKDHTWEPDATITVDVTPRADFDLEAYHFEYTTEGTKNAWYDYLKVWEGHKNNWYDYAKVWENSVNFVRVK